MIEAVVLRVRSPGGEVLGDVFDRSPNALNLLRLLLSVEVVAWHAYSLDGTRQLPHRLQWFVSDIGVDGFFVISGLLICRAWLRRPNLRHFWAARARRILPGLWASLALTAFVIVPVACAVAGHAGPSFSASLGFVVNNAGIAVHQWGIDSTTATLHDPGWNGSLWTLMWELFGYILIATLGVLGLLRAKVVGALLVLAWSYATVVALLDLEPHTGSIWAWMPPRAGLMFLTGALLWLVRHRVRLDGRLALCAASVVPVSIAVLPDYRVLGAPAVAYLLVWCALCLGRRHERTVLSADLSYGVYIYAFPVQQALLLVGWAPVRWPLFFLVSTAVVLPIAALSWVCVEKSALAGGRTLSRRPKSDAPVRADNGVG